MIAHMGYYDRNYGPSSGPQMVMNSRWTPAVKKLVIANVAVYFLQSFTGQFNPGDPMLQLFALQVSTVVKEFQIWQFFTYMFLHANLSHIFFNMLGLWMFGGEVERRLGTTRFWWLYFGSGITGGLLHFAMQLSFGSWQSPMLGASGACFGVFIAFAMLYKDAMILAFFFIPMKARTAAIIFVALTLFLSSQGFQEGGLGSRIAHFAHLGGMIFAYLFIKWPEIASGKVFRALLSRRRAFRPKIYTEEPSEEVQDGLARQVDKILDKIHRDGVSSLTDRERQILDEASKKL